MIRNAIVHIALLVILCSCGGNSGRDRKFDRIDTIADTEPRKALEMLDSIDYDNLSERERHRHDLLTIKARDKAYILHTSDSLIRDVLDYYSSRTSDPLYPQALYYGGRVYSDLGDYPTALQYFQDALDKIPDDDDNLALRGAAISQTGRLLDDLRLYSEAIPYVKQSIMIVKQLNDTFNIAYDYQLLSGIYIHAGKLDSASTYLKEAIRFSSSLPNADKANILIHLADILHTNGEIDSALQVIRPLVKSADSICHNYALAVASEIYRDACIPDTAYAYAYELAMSKNQNNRKAGFQILFSPKLSNIVPKDTLLSLIPKYKQCLEDYLSSHEANLALIQQASYNYDFHLTEKKEAESRRNKMYIAFLGTVVIILMLIAVVLYLKLRNSILLSELNRLITCINAASVNNDDDNQPVRTEEMEKYLDDIAQKLEKADFTFKVPDIILKSDIYLRLQQRIEENKCIPETDCIWQELELLVEQASPGFKSNLRKFSDGKITDVEIQVALLIKCGITPSKMAKLLNRAKNTISTRRKSLFVKIFGNNRNPKILDNFILYLGNY